MLIEKFVSAMLCEKVFTGVLVWYQMFVWPKGFHMLIKSYWFFSAMA